MDLGQSILQFSRVISDGLVIFFPSYAYLASAVRTWTQAPRNGARSLWDSMSSLKGIFMEPAARKHFPLGECANGNQTQDTVDSVLEAYSAHIHSPPKGYHQLQSKSGFSDDTTRTGAILLAVINGSLSEGINFADRLGRGIIVVGLPFANPHSPEWKAKMEFLERRAPSASAASAASRDFYENACMRSVNQSIGRAIRHKDDYAAILLLDRRYEREGIRKKLPSWIQESLVVGGGDGFGGTMQRLRRFFDGKQSR